MFAFRLEFIRSVFDGLYQWSNQSSEIKFDVLDDVNEMRMEPFRISVLKFEKTIHLSVLAVDCEREI